MIKNTLTYSELVVLLTWIRGKDALVTLSPDDVIKNTTNFKWEHLHQTALAMEIAGIGEKFAKLTDSVFEDIFESTLEVFKLINMKELEDKLNNFTDYDMVEKIGDKLGFNFTINDKIIKEEIEKLHRYRDIIDNIFLTYHFINPELSNKQLKKLEKELEIHIQNERYEECTIIQEKITEIKKENT